MENLKNIIQEKLKLDKNTKIKIGKNDFKNLKVGDKIRIIKMEDPTAERYNGKEGTIEFIDSIGQLHGTWGGLAIIPEIDEIEVID